MINKTTQIKVRGFHLDLYNHVNNARYLEFLEEARWNYYENIFETNKHVLENKAFVVVNININYRYPAFLSDMLYIEINVKSVSSRSITISQKITCDKHDKIIVDAEVTFVITDVTTGKSLPIEGELKTLLAGE
jgi:thioesterase-3